MPLISTPIVLALATSMLTMYDGYTGWNNIETISKNLQNLPAYGLCQIQECCHDNSDFNWIDYQTGFSNLRTTLYKKVHGQPQMVNPIVNSIKKHFFDKNPPKALVFYFSGWTGTGKTFTSKLIASSLYRKQMKSKYVKFISAVHHFPRRLSSQDDIARNKHKLRNMIKETIEKCERSLIIIDEIDKLPAGVIDALKPLVDFNESVDNLNYRKATFILMSNTGSEKLKEFAYYMHQQGKSREDLYKNKKEIENILKSEASHEEGGLVDSTVLDNHLINIFVPFLPLERKHIDMCIKDEMNNQNITLPESEAEDFVNNIANELTYFPAESKLYSKSGCKSIYEKVSNYISYKDEL